MRGDCRHVYYVWPARYDAKAVGASRAAFIRALVAEGFPANPGYVAPLYRLPLFQKKLAFGAEGYPFTLSQRSYTGELCPVTERMHQHEELGFGICSFELSDKIVEKLILAFRKVYENRAALRALDDAA